MNRTVEKVLGIIGLVINFLSAAPLVFMLIVLNGIADDPMFEQELEDAFYSNSVTEAELDLLFADNILAWVSGFGWFIAILMMIAMVLTIIALVKLKSNSKLARILLIISGVISGIISIQGILLIIAGIMCIVRQPKQEEPII
ncbi:DUF4064 domain-containing protein [Ureibacillus terrenus]|uniref:DUF4064 domain-containing protein n=1 Tax=Ureibacillus terrenus TaxID=118246 RepID=UPI002E2106A5|nr:DUF4064 domain-containing protein [Ureibacillus terrenus]